MEITVEYLQGQIQLLESENRLLKERLENAGISFDDIESYGASIGNTQFDPNQGNRIKNFEVTSKVAETFFELYCKGRRDVFDFDNHAKGAEQDGVINRVGGDRGGRWEVVK